MSLLTVTSVSHTFGGLKALQDVSLTVEQGSITAVIGPNGAGKTTLFNVISGALKCQAGTISFNGSPIHGQPPYKIAQAGISRTFQNIKLFNHMTALENVMVGRHVQSRAGFAAGMLCLPRTWKEEKEIREK
jgi:branched-chain amino acid transport system ATP-binding protein